jgi:hypothetical protein
MPQECIELLDEFLTLDASPITEITCYFSRLGLEPPRSADFAAGGAALP